MLPALVMVLCLAAQLEAQLQVGFYRKTCPLAETIVKEVVTDAVKKESELAADFLRMHFHDCFVRGCDGSILINSTKNDVAEKDSPDNNPSLEGFDVIDAAKAKLEEACRGVVSCADIIAFAARDGVELRGGLSYEVPSGRRDGRISRSSEANENLPRPASNLEQLTQIFARKGLTQEDMIILSGKNIKGICKRCPASAGAHTIGVSRCSSITKRLYNFSTAAATDPTLDSGYAKTLKRRCPSGSAGSNLTVPMDPVSPEMFDSSYYRNLLRHRGLFASDQALMGSAKAARLVRRHAKYSPLFRQRFAEAMVKMGHIGVLTGEEGEVRFNCGVINGC
ncbi:hypothetical protein Taro_020577 [Colocasia esculenta]|uniref:Peroxidase n=1 Tax=Colocasia esculenta TaxID=4460 RepID=A0A843V2R8_COLES|nr:hypothetical protein [Colocasia esculenta]